MYTDENSNDCRDIISFQISSMEQFLWPCAFRADVLLMFLSVFRLLLLQKMGFMVGKGAKVSWSTINIVHFYRSLEYLWGTLNI